MPKPREAVLKKVLKTPVQLSKSEKRKADAEIDKFFKKVQSKRAKR